MKINPHARRFTVVLALIISILLNRSQVFAVNCDSASIQAIAPKNTTISSATTTGTPSYCDVMASITTDKAKGNVVNFEIGLPQASSWNSRFLFTGNAGFGGSIALDVSDLQTGGYATAATDTGHTALSNDASWALNNVQGVKDFEYRAVHDATVASEAIVGDYYSGASFHSYFNGCSTGGRQGLVEAQKYPKDFDGIIAGDPAIGDPFINFNASAQQILQTAGNFIDSGATKLLDEAVLSECDDKDGVVDGLIQDPSVCNFDPATLQCAPGQTSGCLSSGQVASFKAIFAGAVDTHGKPLYVGYSVSDVIESSPADSAWGNWLTGCPVTQPICLDPLFGPSAAEPWTGETPPLNSPGQWGFQEQVLRNFVFNNPNYDTRTFDFTSQKLINQVTNANKRWDGDGMKANLKSFTKLGHKLLMYHGWSDPALSPYISVQYYNSVQAVLGSSTTADVRLFMVPGMHHCQGLGPGPNNFDPLTPVTQWVEGGTLPNSIIASHHINDDPTKPVDRTMPLCVYPTLAQYNNIGPLNDSSSWSCP